MKLYVTRDSVAAGDDGDAPHAREATLQGELTVEQLVAVAIQISKLPTISGGRATWCVSSAIPLAVVAQEWEGPRMIRSMPPRIDELDVVDGEVRFHISYFAQQDANTIFDVLRRLRLRAE